jgi:hypothetical protein
MTAREPTAPTLPIGVFIPAESIATTSPVCNSSAARSDVSQNAVAAMCSPSAIPGPSTRLEIFGCGAAWATA